MPEAFISLGSNLGSYTEGVYKSPENHITDALNTMSAHPEINVLKISSFYQTAAIGPGKQPDYINAAIKIETNLNAYALLETLQLIEAQQGRVRKQRWDARTLDLDILVYDQLIENTEKLTLPHPRAHERAFVLAPLADIHPNLEILGQGKVCDLLANCAMQNIIKLIDK